MPLTEVNISYKAEFKQYSFDVILASRIKYGHKKKIESKPIFFAYVLFPVCFVNILI